MKSSNTCKFLCVLIIGFVINNSNAQQPSWPVNSSVTGYNEINCTFAERHSQFHGALDLNVGDNNSFLAILDGEVIESADNVSFFVSGHDYLLPNSPTTYLKKVRYGDNTDPLSGVFDGSDVNQGQGLGTIISGNHLHFEMWERACLGCDWYLVDPLRETTSDYVNLPPGYNDTYDVELNDIILEPMDNSSGIIFNAGNGLTAWHFNSCKIHKRDRPDSQGPVHAYNSSPITVYGSILPTVHVRDTRVTANTPSIGEGLGIYSCVYYIDDVAKYFLEFDELSQDHKPNWTTFFNTKYNQATGQSERYGNHDYIKLHRLNNDQYTYAHKTIDRGIWKTRQHISNSSSESDIPAEVLYPDGQYDVDFSVLDANGNRDDGSNLIKVDNFQPFLTRFKINSLFGAPIVDFRREQRDPSSGPANGTLTNDEAAVNNSLLSFSVYVQVTVSEKMSGLEYRYKTPLGLWSNWIQMTKNPTNELVYTGPWLSYNDECYLFNFRGTDLNDNPLIDVYNLTNGNDIGGSINVPVRNGANSWANDPLLKGSDTFEACPSCASEISDLTSTPPSIRSLQQSCDEIDDFTEEVDIDCNGNVIITLSNLGDSFYIGWWDGDEYVLGSNVHNGTLGMNCFRIETIDGCCFYEGCVEANMEDANPLTITFDQSLPCPGEYFGHLEVASVTGGTGPYFYVWNNGQTGSVLEDITAGTYCVTVKDVNGCTGEACFDLLNAPGCSNENCPPMIYEMFILAYPCEGESNGALSAPLDQGYEAYSYAWSNGATTETIYNLPAGDYCVTVTSVDACTEVRCKTLPEQNRLLDLALDVTPVSSPNASDGAIGAVVSGGQPPYTFSWTGPNGFTANSQNISGLVPGDYCLTVTSPGCYEAIDCITLGYECPGDLNVSIVINELGCVGGYNSELTAIVTGGIGPYTFVWKDYYGTPLYTTQTISNIPIGWWTVIVTDEYGCTDYATILLWGQQVIQAGVTVDPNPLCAGETATATVTASGGTSPYNYEWRTCNYPYTTFPNNSPTINGLGPGCYTVTVSDQEGCRSELYFYVNQTPAMNLNADIQEVCSGTLGSIVLNLSGGLGPYSYLWSNGKTSKDIYNLQAGNYCVTVTDAAGCTASDCFTVAASTLAITSASVTDNSCGTSCNGSINIEVNSSGPVSYAWSNGATTQDISGLCNGDYEVVITSGGCVIKKTYTVNGVPQGFDYEVEVLWHFYNSFYGGGVAQVRIISDILEGGGTIAISTSPQMNPVIVSTFTVYNKNYRDITIPAQYSNVSTFYFTYTAANGCVYSGSFGMIPTCTFPDNGLSFGVEHIGDIQGACGVGQEHTYKINIYAVGNNAPYFIKVTMDEASHPSEADYTQIVEYTGQNPFYIYGVPAGSVRFESINKCEYGSLSTRLHTNCCFGLTCDVLYEGYSEAYDGSYFYDLPYFRLWVGEQCFDPDCGLFDGDCSSVWVDLNTVAPTFNCWTGTITVLYPNNTTSVFEVVPNSPGNDEIEWVSGDDSWDPQSPGTYFIKVTYTGNGASTGQNCVNEIEINFYGPTNYSDAVGFNDDFWFNYSFLPEWPQFSNAYFGAWRCEVCSSETNYIFGNNQDACDSYGNWQFTFFDFVPNDYSNPCNSGGTLTIMDFDQNGTAIIQQVQVPANSAIAELTGLQPFGSSIDTWCSNSGWCLFDALDVYGFSMDKPLLATWAQEETCEDIVWNDPTTPNPDPCQSDNDCPPGFVCVDGNCYQECPDGECLYGVCIEGICVESSDCEPSCPPGYECIEGECYLEEEFCGFYEEVNGGSGVNTYNFYHNLPPGTVVEFAYNTLTREDEIFISGSGINDHIACVGTGGWQSNFYTITGGNTIKIVVSPCQTGSKYHFSITCDEALRSNPPSNLDIEGMEDEERIVAYPNPFTSNIDIEAFNIATPFKGQIVLMDNLGRALTTRETVFEAGYNRLNIDGLEHLPSGMYFIVVRKSGEVYAFRKVIKVE